MSGVNTSVEQLFDARNVAQFSLHHSITTLLYKIIVLSGNYLPLAVGSITVLRYPTHPTADKQGGVQTGRDNISSQMQY